MDTDVLLSVIVPAYNVAEWLPRCLDSILAQTYKNIQIIVIDDGSTDETPQIVDDYAKRHNQVVAVHQHNKGLVETRERGIREAKGEFVGFVDGDDEIAPEMYEKLMGNALKFNAQISQCGIMYCFYDGRRKPIHGTGKLTTYNRIEGCTALLKGDEMEPSLCNKVYHSSILKDSCLDHSVINNEDMLRNIVLFDRAKRSVMEDFCGYLYWRRNESMSNNKKAVEIGKNILRARKKILEYVPAELRKEAQNNYYMGAINTYNSLIGNTVKDAAILRKECRQILSGCHYNDSALPVSMRMKIIGIRFFPFVYDRAQEAHNRKRRKTIKKQVSLLREG